MHTLPGRAEPRLPVPVGGGAHGCRLTDLTYQAEHAVINLRVGRYEEAIQILNNILKTDPKYGEAYRLLGLCQIQLKKTDEACGNFKKAKELGDPNADELITKYCK